MTQKIDGLIQLITKLFDLITLAMNKLIQFRSQLGTIIGYGKKDAEKLDGDDRSIDADSRPVDESTDAKTSF
jgi:hypothetical protein